MGRLKAYNHDTFGDNRINDDSSRKAAKGAKESLLFFNKAIDSPDDAILHKGFSKIQQITQPHPAKT